MWHKRKNAQQIIVRIEAVGLRCFHQSVNHGAGICPFRCISEQPRLSAYHKRTDGIFSKLLEISTSPCAKKRLSTVSGSEHKLLLRLICYRSSDQPSSVNTNKPQVKVQPSLDAHVFEPRHPKRRNAFQGKQFHAIFVAYCGFGCFGCSILRHSFAPLPPHVSPTPHRTRYST